MSATEDFSAIAARVKQLEEERAMAATTIKPSPQDKPSYVSEDELKAYANWKPDSEVWLPIYRTIQEAVDAALEPGDARLCTGNGSWITLKKNGDLIVGVAARTRWA
jgi:hypothetical protein